MSGVKLEGNALGTGVFTIKSPNSNTDRTFDLPDAAGTVMVSGNIPTFSAYASVATSITASTWTKVQFQTEEWDTANCFDNASTYRFTPNVAGYYMIVTGISAGSVSVEMSVGIYKNGAQARTAVDQSITSGATYSLSVSGLVYLNGTTDYVEAYVYVATSGKTTSTGAQTTYFQGYLARAA